MYQHIDALVASITPEVYQRLSAAVETGRWGNSVPLTIEQKSQALQLVLLWQAKNNLHPQHMSIGLDGKVVLKSRQQLKKELCNGADITCRKIP